MVVIGLALLCWTAAAMVSLASCHPAAAASLQRDTPDSTSTSSWSSFHSSSNRDSDTARVIAASLAALDSLSKTRVREVASTRSFNPRRTSAKIRHRHKFTTSYSSSGISSGFSSRATGRSMPAANHHAHASAEDDTTARAAAAEAAASAARTRRDSSSSSRTRGGGTHHASAAIKPIINITAIFEADDLDDFVPVYDVAMNKLKSQNQYFKWAGSHITASGDMKDMLTRLCGHYDRDRSQIRLIVVFGKVSTVQVVNLVSHTMAIPVIGYMLDKGDNYVQIHNPFYLSLQPSMGHMASGMVNLLEVNFWFRVTTITQEALRHDGFHRTLRELTRDGKWVIEDDVFIPSDITDFELDSCLNHTLNGNTSRILILHSSSKLARRIFRSAARILSTDNEFAWIITKNAYTQSENFLADYPLGLKAFLVNDDVRRKQFLRDVFDLISEAFHGDGNGNSRFYEKLLEEYNDYFHHRFYPSFSSSSLFMSNSPSISPSPSPSDSPSLSSLSSSSSSLSSSSSSSSSSDSRSSQLSQQSFSSQYSDSSLDYEQLLNLLLSSSSSSSWFSPSSSLSSSPSRDKSKGCWSATSLSSYPLRNPVYSSLLHSNIYGLNGKLAFDDDGFMNISKYRVRNLVNDGRKSVWQDIGCVSGNEIRPLRIVWPGDAKNIQAKTEGKKRYRVVTNPVQPFVITEAPHQDYASCISDTPCLNLTNKEKSKDVVWRAIEAYENGAGEESELYRIQCCRGLTIDLLNKLASDLDFTFTLYIVQDETYGRKEENGTWTGMMQDLHGHTAHFAIGAFSITSQREKAIDFTSPYFFSGFSIIYSDSQRETSMLAFLEPFSTKVWFAIFLTAHVTAVFMALFEWNSPFGLNPWGRKRDKNYSLASGLTMVFSVLFGHTVKTKSPKSWPSKLLQNIWSFVAIFIIASYTANLAAFIAGKHAGINYVDIQDHRLQAIRVGVLPGSAVDEVLKNMGSPLVAVSHNYKVPKTDVGIDWVVYYMTDFCSFHLEISHCGVTRSRTCSSRTTVTNLWVKTVEDRMVLDVKPDLALEGLTKKELDALLGDYPILDYARAHLAPSCELKLITKMFGDDQYGIGIPKLSPLKAALSKKISEYHRMGYIADLIDVHFADAHCIKKRITEEDSQLKVTHHAGLFVMLCVGFGVGVIVLVMEFLIFRFLVPHIRQCPQTSRWKSVHLMFVSQRLQRIIYSAELVSPHQSAKEMLGIVKKRDFARLFQKSTIRRNRLADIAKTKRINRNFYDIVEKAKWLKEMRDNGLMDDEDPETPNIIEIPLNKLTVNIELGASNMKMDQIDCSPGSKRRKISRESARSREKLCTEEEFHLKGSNNKTDDDSESSTAESDDSLLGGSRGSRGSRTSRLASQNSLCSRDIDSSSPLASTLLLASSNLNSSKQRRKRFRKNKFHIGDMSSSQEFDRRFSVDLNSSPLRQRQRSLSVVPSIGGGGNNSCKYSFSFSPKRNSNVNANKDLPPNCKPPRARASIPTSSMANEVGIQSVQHRQPSYVSGHVSSSQTPCVLSQELIPVAVGTLHNGIPDSESDDGDDESVCDSTPCIAPVGNEREGAVCILPTSSNLLTDNSRLLNTSTLSDNFNDNDKDSDHDEGEPGASAPTNNNRVNNNIDNSNKALVFKTSNIDIARSLLYKTRSCQDHFPVSSECAQTPAASATFRLDNVTKEELLLLWKTSENDLNKQLDAALVEKAKLERQLALLQKHHSPV